MPVNHLSPLYVVLSLCIMQERLLFFAILKNKALFLDQPAMLKKPSSPSVMYRLSLTRVPCSILPPPQNFAKEFMISDIRELDENYIRTELKKAGGANYDAQAE